MKPQDLLEALRQARLYLEIKFGLCPPDILSERLPGATIQSIAAIYTHAVLTEDAFVHRSMLSTDPLFASPAWSSRIAFPPNVGINTEWARDFRPDLRALREYADAVYAATDVCLASAADEDVARMVPKHLAVLREGRPAIEQREVPLWFVLMDDVILHTAEHTGEISALLGARGLKGSPWG
jgi:hypothetical protein